MLVANPLRPRTSKFVNGSLHAKANALNKIAYNEESCPVLSRKKGLAKIIIGVRIHQDLRNHSDSVQQPQPSYPLEASPAVPP